MGINDVYVTKEYNGQQFTSKLKCELYNDHFENAKRYNIPHAQLIIADIPYNLSNAGVHFNKKLDLELKQMTQKKFMEVYPEIDFIKIFGKSYL